MTLVGRGRRVGRQRTCGPYLREENACFKHPVKRGEAAEGDPCHRHASQSLRSLTEYARAGRVTCGEGERRVWRRTCGRHLREETACFKYPVKRDISTAQFLISIDKYTSMAYVWE